MNQRQIESAAGIDEAIAAHMMAEKTSAARQAMSMLKLCVACFEPGAFTFLKLAVLDCKAEMSEPQP